MTLIRFRSGLLRRCLLLGVLLLPCLLCVDSSVADKTSKSATRPIKREIREVAGWQVHIDLRLIETEPGATDRAVELLQKQLVEIRQKVPAPAVKELQKVPLYFSPQYPNSGGRAEFHPGQRWLVENGRDPVMVKAVEFSNIMNFEAEMVRMPNFALHELAHAYHNLVLPGGFGNADVTRAFETARDSGKYDNVERWHGVSGRRTQEKAYAMSSPMEYFAETTEAYFSRNDFFPYDPMELKSHDPQMFELLGQLWGVHPQAAGVGHTAEKAEQR